MTLRDHLRELLTERRDWPRDSAEWTWRTRAARKYVWLLRGVPPKDWPK